MSSASVESYYKYQPDSGAFSSSNQNQQQQTPQINYEFATKQLCSLTPMQLLDPSYDSIKRLQTAFSFMVLGRTKAGAREVANALKLCLAADKPDMLLSAGIQFLRFNDKEMAYHCFREGIIQCNSVGNCSNKVLNKLEENIEKLSISSSSSSDSLEDLFNYKEQMFQTMLSKLPTIDTIKQQILNYRSLLNSSFEFSQKNQYALSLVKQYDQFQAFDSDSQKLDLLSENSKCMNIMMERLVEALTAMTDLSFYESTLASNQLIRMLQMLSITYFCFNSEISFETPNIPETYYKMIKRVQKFYDTKKKGLRDFVEDIGFDLKKSLLIGLRLFVQNEYEASKDILDRVITGCHLLSHISYIEHTTNSKPKKFNAVERAIINELTPESRKGIKIAFSRIGICASIYSSQCFVNINGKEQSQPSDELRKERKKELKTLIHNLQCFQAKCIELEIQIRDDLTCTALGKLFEIFSFYESSIVVPTKADPNSKEIKLNETYLELMIDNYIEAINHKHTDDPQIVRLYNKLLWGMLMHGGFHIQLFWIVKLFRDYSCFNSDCSAISFEEQCNFNKDIFKLEDHINARVEVLIEKLYNQRRQCRSKTGSMILENSNKFNLPQVFYGSNYSLVISAAGYSKTEASPKFRVSSSGFFFKSILKDNKEQTQNLNKLGDELLLKWSRGGFMQSKEIKDIPFIQHFIKTYYDGDKSSL